MKPATPSLAHDLPNAEPEQDESGGFSTESVLNILKLILDESELADVLTTIARLAESVGNGMFCTIWLPVAGGKQLYCAVAPSLPGFPAHVGHTSICANGASGGLSQGAGLCCRHS